MHAKVRAKVEEPVDISGEDELTPEKIALYVDTLASIKGVAPTVSVFCYQKCKQIALKDQKAGKYEWIIWNGYDLPMTVTFTFKCKNMNLNGRLCFSPSLGPRFRFCRT